MKINLLYFFIQFFFLSSYSLQNSFLFCIIFLFSYSLYRFNSVFLWFWFKFCFYHCLVRPRSLAVCMVYASLCANSGESECYIKIFLSIQLWIHVKLFASFPSGERSVCDCLIFNCVHTKMKTEFTRASKREEKNNNQIWRKKIRTEKSWLFCDPNSIFQFWAGHIESI